MQFTLPDAHGLHPEILSNGQLLPRDDTGAPSLTDVQFEALSAGVGRAVSALCVAPTSTGKTLVGIWALYTWLMNQPTGRAVYLVTHRALARQKFEELSELLGSSIFSGDKSCIVLANGDVVIDGAGSIPSEPLAAPLLIATYEKFLAMLSASGARSDMSDCVLVCDEIQIVGDQTRGKSIEVLLTLLKKATWGQFVGLSAVLDPIDADLLSDWLGVHLIRLSGREKHLAYECRAKDHIFQFDTAQAALGITSRARSANEGLSTLSIVREQLGQPGNHPVVVFCMSKKRVYELALSFAGAAATAAGATATPLLSAFDEETSAARELTDCMASRVAFHTANLRETERRAVEEALANKSVDVVFATSTLAAGVNFPIGTVIFDAWKIWNAERRIEVPLLESEFQNMAGRAGRMGYEGLSGKVYLSIEGNVLQQRAAMVYLNPDQISRLKPQLSPSHFDQTALQLLSAGICRTIDEIESFLVSTFSAFCELKINASGLAHWRESINGSIRSLERWGYVL